MESREVKKSSGLKVCLPTMNDRGLDDLISEHFGRAPSFTIVDLETKEVEVLPNTSEHMGGTSHPPQIMADAGVEVILCSNLGPRAIQMFEQFGIEVYVGAYGTVKDAIQAWQAGRLQVADDKKVCKKHKHK